MLGHAPEGDCFAELAFPFGLQTSISNHMICELVADVQGLPEKGFLRFSYNSFEKGFACNSFGGWRVLYRLKRRKVREPFITYQMANLAPKRHRSHLLLKNQDCVSGRSIQSSRKSRQAGMVTPPRRGQWSPLEGLITVKRQQIDRSHTQLFPSSQTYRLDYLNSITYDDGKLFNLLTTNAEKFKNGRRVKCKCSKSRCESKYCECFSRGVICGVECECSNCHNLTWIDRDRLTEEQKGCRCSKSHCLKNYCECFQRGERCGDKCNCTNCQNVKQ